MITTDDFHFYRFFFECSGVAGVAGVDDDRGGPFGSA
jgi:hypothetical protein